MVSIHTISSTSLHIAAQRLPELEMVEVNCTLTAKETSSYIRTVSLDNTRDGGAQRLTDNLVPYTNYTATCLVFKDGVDQCYLGSDTAHTYTDSEYYSISSSIQFLYIHMHVHAYIELIIMNATCICNFVCV